MQSNCLRREANRERTLAELHQLLERTQTDILLAYLPVVRIYSRAHRPVADTGATGGGPAGPAAPPGRADDGLGRD